MKTIKSMKGIVAWALVFAMAAIFTPVKVVMAEEILPPQPIQMYATLEGKLMEHSPECHGDICIDTIPDVQLFAKVVNTSPQRVRLNEANTIFYHCTFSKNDDTKTESCTALPREQRRFLTDSVEPNSTTLVAIGNFQIPLYDINCNGKPENQPCWEEQVFKVKVALNNPEPPCENGVCHLVPALSADVSLAELQPDMANQISIFEKRLNAKLGLPRPESPDFQPTLVGEINRAASNVSANVDHLLQSSNVELHAKIVTSLEALGNALGMYIISNVERLLQNAVNPINENLTRLSQEANAKLVSITSQLTTGFKSVTNYLIQILKKLSIPVQIKK